MGHDVNFYNKAKTDILYLRNHNFFLEFLPTNDAEICDPVYTDFYVTVDMLVAGIKTVEARMAPAAVLRLTTGEPVPLLDDLETTVPEAFCWGPPDDMTAALPHYRTLLVHLLAWAKVDNVLICGWSA